jgi:quinol monooxygenase YgiN
LLDIGANAELQSQGHLTDWKEKIIVATLFVRHRVGDYARFRKAYDDFDTLRRELGVSSHGVYKLDGNPNDVTIYHEFSNMDAAKAFAANPKLKEAMQAAGVQGAPEIWFTNRD